MQYTVTWNVSRMSLTFIRVA